MYSSNIFTQVKSETTVYNEYKGEAARVSLVLAGDKQTTLEAIKELLKQGYLVVHVAESTAEIEHINLHELNLSREDTHPTEQFKKAFSDLENYLGISLNSKLILNIAGNESKAYLRNQVELFNHYRDLVSTDAEIINVYADRLYRGAKYIDNKDYKDVIDYVEYYGKKKNIKMTRLVTDTSISVDKTVSKSVIELLRKEERTHEYAHRKKSLYEGKLEDFNAFD